MNIIIETGSESHTTSHASFQVKFRGGAYDGQYLYQQKQFQVAAEWDNVQGGRWVKAKYNLPEGQEIEIIGKGATGPRGVNKHDFHRIYRLDSQAEVLEEEVGVGLRACSLKGRLVLVNDRLATKKAATKEALDGEDL